ncbi:DUF748 domain-containing protein [Aquabacterium lacunae]|uniref:DUF748 domain-containing protein n=1 Tax=Aquabacterium lacunae TaxID=2528630 RepID=A0A4Q9H538_9BURK|nr:DUF748 domain-containing protein [Aquabacterium lacunae]TBO34255.1 DUF748 domain-containing protein [Aquabacterium lacunae]
MNAPTDTPTSPLASGARPTQSRRWLRPTAVAAAVLATWGLGVGVGLPRLIQSQVEQQGEAALGVPVQVGAVRLSPLTLALEIDRLEVGPPQARWLRVGQARVRPSLESLWRLAPVIAEVQLVAPQVTLVRTGDTTFNITPVLERLRARPASPDTGEPARFAVANIAVRDGRFVFDDQVLQQHHTIDQLALGIPFLSNLPVFIDSQVQPLLKARVDGSPLTMSGQTLPFKDGRQSTLNLQWQQVDVAHWLRAAQPFLPAEWGVSPQGGTLSTDLTLHFEQPAKAAPVVRLTGQASLDRLGLSATRLPGLGQTTLGWQSLKVQGLDTQPLRQQARVGQVSLQGLTLAVRPATGQPTRSTPAARSQPSPRAEAAQASPWQWAVGTASLQASRIDVQTAALPWPQLTALQAQVKGLSNDPKAAAAAWQLALSDEHGGQVKADGTVHLPSAHTDLTVALQDVQVPAWLKPLEAGLDLPVALRQGKVSAQWPLAVQWAARADAPAALSLKDGTVQLADWQARTRPSRSTPLPLQAEQIDFQRLSLQGIQAVVPLTGNTPPQARVADTVLEGFNARVQQGDLKLALQQTRLQVRNASTDLKQPVQLDLQARTPGQGTLAVQGEVRPQPLNAKLKVKARQLDLSPLQPLLAPHVNVVLASGRAQADGQLTLQRGAGSTPALKAGYQGMVGLNELKLLDTVNDGTLLSWRQLALNRAQFDWQDDGQKAPQLNADLGQIQLADFFGRVIVNADGRLNLAQIVKQASQTEPTSLTTPQAPTGSPTSTAPASPAAPAPAAPNASAAAPASPASERPTPVMDLRWQGITLAQGRVDFTDLFIKPNYSANLTRIGGTVSAVAARNPEPATVDIAGSVDDAAPLKISGRIHPLGPTLFTDIQASAKGVELTRLSPYAARYAGYNIDKGSLSMDVSYKVDGGKLAAENRIFLDQLTFGERNNSPDATHLPVQLAVALLKNSRGEIDINLPISGSINDPQFSVGGILWKVVVNLVTKALTAPFSLLMGGGGEEMSFVAFAPGSAVLDDTARKRLDALGAKLADKGGLKLDATGWADAGSDTEGLRDEHVRQLMRAAKAKATGQAVEDTEVAPAEEAQWLAAAYKAADIKKPRNLVGLAKTLPPAEMKALLRASAPTGNEALTRLANQRGNAVKAYLVQKVPADRVLLTASKLNPEKAADDKGPVTRVQLGVK